MNKIFGITLIMVLCFNMNLFANPIINFFSKPLAKQATKQGVKVLGKEAAETGVKVGLKQGAKALIKNSDNIALPLMKKAALETAEHGVTSPRIMQKLVVNFGDDAALKITKKVPQCEMPMFLRYVEAADSPATRKLFVECYQKEGADIFKRITPNMILATGLTATMLYGTHRATSPMVAAADLIENNPNVANNFVNKASEELRSFFTSLLAKPLLFISIIIGIIILNKFGIFGQFYNFIKGNNSKQTICSERKVKPLEAVICESDSTKN